MELDKTLGEWLHGDVELIDDIAYHLYCQCKKDIPLLISPQVVLMRFPEQYADKYKKAKGIIRREKINKITNGIR